MTPNPAFLCQYEALTNSVGIAELASRTILAVTGVDRMQILQSFTTNDVKKLVAGQGCEAFVTSPQGKTLGHLLIFCEAGQYAIDTAPGQAPAMIVHFDRYVITEDVQFADCTAQFCDLLVAGPKAGQLLAAISGVDPPAEIMGHAPATIAGCQVVVRRVEFAGPLSYFVQASSVDAQAVAAVLTAAGAVRCEGAAVESARLEAGVPLFGVDITPDNLPQEVARDARAISFTKGCYLGQETVARIDAVGHVNRQLAGVQFAGPDIPASGTSLLAGQQEVGHVTSAAWSPRLAAPLALTYLRRNQAKNGTPLSSAVGEARVVTLPIG